MAEVIAHDRLSLMVVDQSIDKVVAAYFAKDHLTHVSAETNKGLTMMMRAREGLFDSIENIICAEMGDLANHCACNLYAFSDVSYRSSGLVRLLDSSWQQLAFLRGFKVSFGFTVNPISIAMYKRVRTVIKDKLVKLADFEFEGAKPFENFVFPDGSPSEVHGLLGYLKVEGLKV